MISATDSIPHDVRLHGPGRFELVLERLVQVLEDPRRDRFERRDPEDHVAAKLGRKEGQNLRRLIGIEMGQDDGDRLGMLDLEEVGDRLRVEPLEGLEAGVFPGARREGLHDPVRFLLTQGLEQDLSHVPLVGRDESPFAREGLVVLGDDLPGRLRGDRPQVGHMTADRPDIADVHVPQHLGGNLFAHGREEDGRLVPSRQLRHPTSPSSRT